MSNRPEERLDAAVPAAAPRPPPIVVPRRNLEPLTPYIPPELPPTVCKIALLHGTNSETMFTLPDNIEVILFSGRGRELSRSAVQMITSWIHKSPILNTLDLITYNGFAYNSAYYSGGFPGGNNTPPMRFNNRGIIILRSLKLRSSTEFRIKVLKSGNRCPNITFTWGPHQDGILADPVGIYNPHEVVLRKNYFDFFYQKEGQDIPTSVSLLQRYPDNFSLENLVAFFIERYPGEKVRIYILSCRAGDLVPPNAGNLTPNVTRTIVNGLPNLRGGKRKNKKRHTARRLKYTH